MLQKKKNPYVQQKVYKHNVYSLITVFEVNTKWRRGGKGKLKHLGKESGGYGIGKVLKIQQTCSWVYWYIEEKSLRTFPAWRVVLP